MSNNSPEVSSIASKELVVLTRESSSKTAFRKAISGRSFNALLSGHDDSLFPDAILQAHSVSSVQQAVQYCSLHNLQICVRSGGHSWESTWLQGTGTVLLDVGNLDVIHPVDPTSRTVQAGPGAQGSAILNALPEHLFFPCGHCRGVPLGGFILGGGYGIGFQKYGMAAMLVSAVEVVLADGSLITAWVESKVPKEKAVMELLRGSYTGFPGVITNYTIGPLPDRPRGVMSGTVFYSLQEWQKALRLASNITLHGDEDAESIEVTVILTYAPLSVQEKTGVAMVAMVALMIWADTPKEGLQLWTKYAANTDGSLLPPVPPVLVDGADVPSSDFYPTGARYQTQVFMGDQALQKLSEAEMETAIQPLVDMWSSSSSSSSPDYKPPPPPPPSHTLLVCIHPNLKTHRHGGKELAIGYTPDMGVQTYAIYQDSSQDDAIRDQLAKAHAKVGSHARFHTSLVEGDTRRHGHSSGFAGQAALEDAQKWIQLLDPEGVFAGFPE